MIQMERQIEAGRGIPSEGIVSARKKFGRYKGESKKSIRGTHVVDDATLASMVSIWKFFVSDTEIKAIEGAGESSHLIKSAYDRILEASAGFDCSPHHLGKFMILLPELLESRLPQMRIWNPETSSHIEKIFLRTSLLLSAFINSGPDRKYQISTENLVVPNLHDNPGPRFLAYRNSKDLIVNGMVGNYFGNSMEAGSIELFGDAGISAGGRMTGGTLIIHGYAGRHLGTAISGGTLICEGNTQSPVGMEMKGGKLIVHGDVFPLDPVYGHNWLPPNAGGGMSGGEIHFEGNIPDESSFIDSDFRLGGKIFHKGKLIASGD
jgi:hypothetical protein